jgi:hypothetical protein
MTQPPPPGNGLLPPRRITRKRKRRVGGLAMLGTALREVYPGKEQFDEALVFGGWNDAVPPRVALNAQPVRFQRGTLQVHVTSPVWAQELSFLKEDLLRQLRAKAPQLNVKDVRFRVGPLPEVARIPSLERPVPVPPPRRAALTAELQLALEFVPDEALREIIRETARVGLGRLEEHEARVKRAEEARERRRVEAARQEPRGPRRR